MSTINQSSAAPETNNRADHGSNGRPQEASTTGESKSRANPRVFDFMDPRREPLVSGEMVQIDQQLVAWVEAAIEAPLPCYEPIEAILEPTADEIADDEVSRHVRDRLLAEPLIAAALLAASLLRQACACRGEQLLLQVGRLTALLEVTPLEVPASKAGQRGWFRELLTFWGGWSGIGLAACGAWLGVTLILENTYQINAFMEGDWGLTQTPFGAFGFTWAFTMGVVVVTRWRLKIRSEPQADNLVKAISLHGFTLAWLGLTGLGLMMGLLHAGEPGDGFLIQVFRCAQTVASVLTLGVVCVAIEWGCERLFRRAYRWTLVENVVQEQIVTRLEPLTTRRAKIDQLRRLAASVEERVERHVSAQTRPWISLRDALRARNEKNRAVAQAQETLNRARLHLKSVQN